MVTLLHACPQERAHLAVTLSLCHEPQPFLGNESSVLGSHSTAEHIFLFCKMGIKVHLSSFLF